MAELPPIPWALSPIPRPRLGEKSPSTNLKATRELPSIRWAMSSSPGPLHDNDSLSINQDAFTINVSRQLESNEHPERLKQSQDDGYIKLESSCPGSECEENDSGASDCDVSTFCEESDNTAVQCAASASAAATLSAAVDLGNRSFPLTTKATCNNRVELVTRKLGYIYDRGARISECKRELDRITAEVTALSKDATNFGSSNDAERFVTHLVTLGEEKHAVSAILQKTAKKYRKSQGRIKKRRQKQPGKKGYSNMVQVKREDWTENPKVVSNAYWNATPAALEASAEVKKEDSIKKEEQMEIGTAAKAEPQIKVGEQ